MLSLWECRRMRVIRSREIGKGFDLINKDIIHVHILCKSLQARSLS